MRHCPTCDAANAGESRFCSRCGTSLDTPQATTTTQVVPMPTSAPAAAALTPAAPISAAPPAPQPINVNVTVAAPAPAAPVVVVAQHAGGPGCLVRALYFLFVGLWLGLLWTGVAWFLLVTILGLPLGLLMLNRLPQVMTLKPVRTTTQVAVQGGAVLVSQGALAQHPFLLRALYFVLIGWWFSGLWLSLAWGLVGVTFGLGLPLAFWMFDRTPAIVTLARQ